MNECMVVGAICLYVAEMFTETHVYMHKATAISGLALSLYDLDQIYAYVCTQV